MKLPRQSRTRTLENDEHVPILHGFATSSNGPVANRTSSTNVAPTQLPGRNATAAQTNAAQMPFNHEAMRAMQQLASNAELNVPDGYVAGPVDHGFIEEPRPSATLPAVISNAVAMQADFVPTWHKVSNTVGFRNSPFVRNLGRKVFSNFTDKEVGEIQVMASGITNSEYEVKAMMAWIVQNGSCLDKADIDFSAVMDGISANVQLWSAEGFNFLLVKDNFSHYIYGWGGGPKVSMEHIKSGFDCFIEEDLKPQLGAMRRLPPSRRF